MSVSKQKVHTLDKKKTTTKQTELFLAIFWQFPLMCEFPFLFMFPLLWMKASEIAGYNWLVEVSDVIGCVDLVCLYLSWCAPSLPRAPAPRSCISPHSAELLYSPSLLPVIKQCVLLPCCPCMNAHTHSLALGRLRSSLLSIMPLEAFFIRHKQGLNCWSKKKIVLVLSDLWKCPKTNGLHNRWPVHGIAYE